MTTDTLIAALVGALFGGLASFGAQAINDRARERARGREAAAMLRAELVRGLTSVALLLHQAKKKDLKRGDLSGFSLLTPVGAYFDSLGLVLTSKMRINWFQNVMAVYARWSAIMKIAEKLENDLKLAEPDHKFLEEWVHDADVAQELLFLVSQRWWPRRRRFGELERELEKRMVVEDAAANRGFDTSGVAEYFTFLRFRRGK